MYYKQPCRLQPTTSYHTVLGFPILACVPAHNFSKFDFIHVTFCVCSFRMDLLVQNDHQRDPLPGRLKLSRVQVHRVTIFCIWLEMGLCADTGYVQSASFSRIYFTSILLKSGELFLVSLSLVMVSYRGSPG